MDMVEEVYRQAASAVLLRPTAEAGKYQVLLLHKPRKRDAWQLPQGGVEEGENPEEAARRELREETGIDPSHIRVLGHSRHVYQYDFPPSYRRFRPDNVCGQQIYFVLMAVIDPVKVTVDAKEIDRYAWVLSDQFSLYIRRPEYLRLVRQILCEAEERMR